MKDILYDPQTSGGLLIAVDRDYQEDLLKALEDSSTDYAIIGEVIEKSATYIQVE
jgi:selenide,water dikinase